MIWCGWFRKYRLSAHYTPQTHTMYIKGGYVCHTANMYNMNIKKTRIQKQTKYEKNTKKYEEIKNGGRMREKERVRRGKLMR